MYATKLADQKLLGFSQTDTVGCGGILLTKFRSYHADYHNDLMHPESILVASLREEEARSRNSISEWIAIGNSQFDLDLELIPRLSTEVFDIPIFDFVLPRCQVAKDKTMVIGWNESQMQAVMLCADSKNPNRLLSEPGEVTLLDNVILEDVSAPFVDTYERLPVWRSINNRESIYFWVNDKS